MVLFTFSPQLSLSGSIFPDSPRGVSPRWSQIQSRWQSRLIISRGSMDASHSFPMTNGYLPNFRPHHTINKNLVSFSEEQPDHLFGHGSLLLPSWSPSKSACLISIIPIIRSCYPLSQWLPTETALEPLRSHFWIPVSLVGPSFFLCHILTLLSEWSWYSDQLDWRLLRQISFYFPWQSDTWCQSLCWVGWS